MTPTCIFGPLTSNHTAGRISWMSDAGDRVREYLFEDDGRIPNNPTLAAARVLQRSQFRAGLLALQGTAAENGWGGAGLIGVFSYHHYHSNAHEVLCVVSGSASIAFGGPEGETVEVQAGDVVVIPAGVGHCNKGRTVDSRSLGPTRAGRNLTTSYRRRRRTSGGTGEHPRRLLSRVRSPVR